MEQIIRMVGKPVKVACDENCDKAWGWTHRPSVQLSDDEDDIEWLCDGELDSAPADTGEYWGGEGKPINKSEIPNKWCVNECERCVMSSLGKYMEPLPLRDFSVRVRNIPIQNS